jgi:hypothetical protein
MKTRKEEYLDDMQYAINKIRHLYSEASSIQEKSGMVDCY